MRQPKTSIVLVLAACLLPVAAEGGFQIVTAGPDRGGLMIILKRSRD